MALNENDLKELASYLGINTDEVENLEKAKDLIGNEFIRKNGLKDAPEFSQAIGSRMGAIEVAVKRLAKENGIELTADEIQGKKVEEVIDLTQNKLKTFHSTKMQELERQIQDNDSKKIIEEWQDKYSKLENTKRDIETMNNTLKTELENTRLNAIKQINSFKVNDISERAFNSIKWNEGINDFAKTGFKAVLNEKYAIDLDENGKPFIMDKTTQTRIANPTKMGEFMNIEDVYKMEAEKNNLTSKVDPNKKNDTFVKRATVEPSASGQHTPSTFIDKRRVTASERNIGRK